MTTKFNQAYNVISIGYHPSDFHPIWGGVKFNPPWSNLTGWSGGKSIEIMTTKFNQAYNVISIGYHPSDFHPIWVGGQIQFPRLNLTGQIGGKSIEIMTTKSQCISTQIDQHLSQWIYTQFEGGPIQSPQSNLTSQIGGKSIEIMTTKCDKAAILYTGRHTNVISVNFHPIWPVIYAQSNLTGRIGCKSIEIMTTKFQCISTQIDQHLSQWIYTQFEGGPIQSPGRISPVKLGVNPLRLWPPNATRQPYYVQAGIQM